MNRIGVKSETDGKKKPNAKIKQFWSLSLKYFDGCSILIYFNSVGKCVVMIFEEQLLDTNLSKNYRVMNFLQFKKNFKKITSKDSRASLVRKRWTAEVVWFRLSPTNSIVYNDCTDRIVIRLQFSELHGDSRFSGGFQTYSKRFMSSAVKSLRLKKTLIPILTHVLYSSNFRTRIKIKMKMKHTPHLYTFVSCFFIYKFKFSCEFCKE